MPNYRDLVIAACGLVVLPFLLTGMGLGITSATEVVVFAIACMALNILVGHTGLTSFGHGAWFGLAAYGAGLAQLIERQLRRDEIRHYPWCAFEEKLAVFEDVPDERGSLLDAMHELARQIAARKRLRIEDIDTKLLATIWRRAAFDDPRLADLSALDEATLDAAYSQLVSWVDAALEERDLEQR